MSTNRDFDRIAGAWLAEGPNELSDRVLDAALDEVHLTDQRHRPAVPWRSPLMTTPLRVAAALAIVAIVGYAGVTFLNPRPNVGSLPSPIPSPTPTPHALTTEFLPLEPGTYITPDGTPDPFFVRVTFTAPDGWEGGLGGPYFVGLNPVSGRGAVILTNFSKIAADPCQFDQGFTDPPPGSSVDDLATALASMPGLVASTPTDVSLGGYSGKQLTLTAPASFVGCILSPDGYAVAELPLGANYTFAADQRSRVWILDIDGTRLVIDAQEMPGQTAQERADAQAILDSIRIAPAKT